MASLKSKISFNKIRNKKDKVKATLKEKKPKKEKVPKPERQKKKRKIGYIILCVITFLAILMILAVGAFAAYIVIKAPKFDEERLFSKESSTFYDINNEQFYTLGMNVGNDVVEKRIKLTYEELPEILIDAVVATEDSRFFQHNGVDLARFIKASIGQVLGHSDAGGASTLTMQVSKNSLTDTTSSGIKGIIRKFTDIYLAVFEIEKNYTKQDILELYLNSEFLGNQSFGVEQASQTYFGKSAKDLSISEAALIAGLFQAPSSYDPYNYPEAAQARRNQVLNLMKRHGYINEEECEIAKSINVEDMLVENTNTVNEYQGYVDTVVEEIIKKYDIDPYKTPLEIYTNLDRNKQKVINNIYDGTYEYSFKDDYIQLSVAVVDNKNGALLAVGTGRNKTGERSYNYATMIKRHPGSTIKPILDYGPAIEYLNWSTYSPLFDEETKYTKGGVLNNWNNKYEGIVTMKKALSKSMNTCALQAFQATTNEQKWNFAQSLGITPGNDNGKIHESASIGAFEGTNPVELASAYSAFANGGYYTEAYSVNKIVNKETGETIENSYTRERVMKETTAYLITNILFNVTPGRAYVSGTQVATKTGTSSYDPERLRAEGIYDDIIQDSWVATYNPDYTIAFWYGYDELSKDHYTTMGAASTQRNIIQGMLTRNILNTGSTFSTPRGITSAKVELETIPARLASEYTPADIVETHLFISGTEPTEVSTRYSKLTDPTNVKVIEENSTAKLTWTGAALPDAVNEEYLKGYFTSGYKQWAEQYLQKRLEYNKNAIGEFGYDIYLKSGTDYKYVGFTTDTSYTVKNTTNYDSIVVRSAYSIFKNNASSGVTVELTGTSTTFKIELQGVQVKDKTIINPTYDIGDTIADMGVKTIKFIVNGKDITDTINKDDIKITIRDCTDTCKEVKKIDNSKAGSYEIVYKINYLGTPYSETRYVHVK